MSILNRTRTSAGATLERSKSSLSAASGRVQTLPDDALNVTRSAVTLALRPLYATVGAGDALVATVTKQREELPVLVKQTAGKVAQTAKARVARAQDTVAGATGELTGRSAEVVGSLRTVTPAATAARARGVAETRTEQAKDAFRKLTARGEQVTFDLRHDPALVRVIRTADSRVDLAANGVTSVAQKVRARATAQAKREAAATTSTPVRATPAKRVPAHKTTVSKTRAAEAPVSDTATHRAAAQETATRAAAAKKAAATRKAKADEAAAKREAAATKAAATRKQAAAERDEAADARHAAAVKAAATRKKNASDA
jgi:hypothetical protein